MIKRGIAQRFIFLNPYSLFLTAILLFSPQLHVLTPADRGPELHATSIPVLDSHQIIPKMTSIYHLISLMLKRPLKFFNAQLILSGILYDVARRPGHYSLKG
jgi:hypothetical protein